MEINLILKKKDYKQNPIRSGDSNDSKVIFALLTNVITLYITSIIINIRQLGLMSLVSGFVLWYLSLEDCLNNFI